jgi:broad specificity phosphatase PhoE
VIELVYETHSMTTDNEQGIATGWLPGRLSEAGRGYARALGERRRNDGLAAVFASDLTRAVETAEIAFAGSGLEVRLDPRLRECNYGELDGRPVSEIDVERLHRIDEPFPGGESYRDVVDRTQSFLEELSPNSTARESCSLRTRPTGGLSSISCSGPRSTISSRPHSSGRRAGSTG